MRRSIHLWAALFVAASAHSWATTPSFGAAMYPRSAYSDFTSMTVGELDTCIIKLSYLGDEGRPFGNVVLRASPAVPNYTVFGFFRDSAIYGLAGDFSEPLILRISPSAMHDVLASMGGVAEVANGSQDPSGVLAVGAANIWHHRSLHVSESIVNESVGRVVIDSMLAHVASDSATRAILMFACAAGLAPVSPVNDVSSRCVVSLPEVTFDRSTGRYVGSISVKNTSATAIAGPVTVALQLRGMVTLASAAGRTSRRSPRAGLQYTQVSANAIGPGADRFNRGFL